MTDQRSAKACTCAAAAVFALAACACTPGPAADVPPSTVLTRADPIITAMAPSPRGELLLLRQHEPDLAGDSVRRVSIAVREIGRAIQAGARDLPSHDGILTVELYGVDVDKFGKRTPARMFALDYETDDLRVANYRQSGPAKIFNLAIDLRIDHAGIAPINGWCMRYPHVGDNICQMAGIE
jgi:hypothetical protein